MGVQDHYNYIILWLIWWHKNIFHQFYACYKIVLTLKTIIYTYYLANHLRHQTQSEITLYFAWFSSQNFEFSRHNVASDVELSNYVLIYLYRLIISPSHDHSYLPEGVWRVAHPHSVPRVIFYLCCKETYT